MNIKAQIKVASGPSILSFVLGLVGHLALTDISHGEANASLEWSILRLGALVFMISTIDALLMFRKILNAFESLAGRLGGRLFMAH